MDRPPETELRPRVTSIAGLTTVVAAGALLAATPRVLADFGAGGVESAPTLLTAAFQSPVSTLALAVCAGVESFLIWGCIQTLAEARLGSAFEIVELEKLLQEKRYVEALSFCEARNRYFTRLVAAGLSSAHLGKVAIEAAVAAVREQHERLHMDRVYRLGTLAGVSLLIGLFGLCWSAMDATAAAPGGGGTFLVLAHGAFFPPAFACVVAIPAFLMEAIYRRRLPTVESRAREESNRLIQLIEAS